ncbi:Histidine kinase-, DNA gyrase B-, and HSP90-like ATPase [Treponema bryantii]|uniref:histidine kinase n=1 Tax=Treponema bryantii TaxID=163 RepID=A0A1I3KC06_9SPIR|nr:sensor histidine kinase [Treponema bryantii]SFI70039.1 Histidine kinase-, DNA gyrase B-, and HSP90-like ATPase [Treponema bryantii]
MNVENAEQEIEKLQNIIQQYTTFFIIFDIVFFITIILIIIFAIQVLKSRRKLRSSNRYLRFTIKGQEEERARIARELHDTVAQDLRYCRNLSEKIDDKNDPMLGKKLSNMLEKSLSYVRSMSYNLAPPDVIRNDIAANVMNLAQNFKELSDVEIRFTMPEKLDTDFLSEEENLNLYRIIQESLMNIRKHAEASEVTVLLRNANGDEPEGLYIFISDDGKGFDVDKYSESRGADGSHFGIVGMKERSDFIRAKLDIDSHPGEGTQISIVKLKNCEKLT